MNRASLSNPPRKSRKGPLLLCVLAALAGAAFVLGFLLFQQFRSRVGERAERAVLPAGVETSPAPMTAPAHAAQGFDLFFTQNDPVGARSVFEACVREHPDYADAYHGLAMAQRETGDPAGALPNHDRSIELSPERADYYRVRGITYQRLKNHDAAIKSFELGLEATDRRFCAPGLLQAGLAQSYRAKGDFKKALAYCDEAIALDPQNKWFYRERGYTYQALGDRERAEADLNKGRETAGETR